jgi:hypothetical protein
MARPRAAYSHIKPSEALYIQISGRESRLGIKKG